MKLYIIQRIIIFSEQICEDQKNVLEIRYFFLSQEKLLHVAKRQKQNQVKVFYLLAGIASKVLM